MAGPAAGWLAPLGSHGEQTLPGIVCLTPGTALTLHPGHGHCVLPGEKPGTGCAWRDSDPDIKFSGTQTLPPSTAVPNRATSINYYVYSRIALLKKGI